MIRKFLFLFLLLNLLTVSTIAEPLEVRNGVSYLINNLHEATVVAGTEKYSGSVVIDDFIWCGEEVYKVTRIGEKAFKDCVEMTSITIPNTITEIGQGAFSGCTLQKVHISDLVAWCNISFAQASIGGEESDYCYIDIDGEAKKRVAPDLSGRMWSKANIYNSNPLSRGAHFYLNGKEIIDLVIPQSVSIVKSGAFAGSKFLKSVDVGNNVKKVGDYAFADNVSLASVTIGNKVERIGKGAFCWVYRVSMTWIEAAPSLSLGESPSLKEVHISNIASWCAINFTPSDDIDFVYSKEHVTTGSNPLQAAEHLYLGSQEITDLVIPNGVKTIAPAAFINCKSFTSVTFPESLTYIGQEAFKDCDNVSELTSYVQDPFEWEMGFTPSDSAVLHVPKGKGISYHDIEAWTNYKNIEEMGGVTYHFNQAIFKRITSDNIVMTFRVDDFDKKECSVHYNGTFSTPSPAITKDYASDLTIPQTVDGFTVTKIGYYAFKNCRYITSIDIPSSVRSIGSEAFWGCKSLKTITVHMQEPVKIDSYTFYGLDIKQTRLYVPVGCTENYRSADIWKLFDIREIGSGPQKGDIFSSLTEDGIELIFTMVSEEDNTCELTAYNGVIGSKLTIPTSVNGITIISIAEKVFADCGELSSIVFPANIQDIGELAFRGCEKLEILSLEKYTKLQKIGDCAFASCGNLKVVKLPDSIKELGTNAFGWNTIIEEFRFPDGLITIANGMFENWTKLRTISFGPNPQLKSIGDEAFRDCYSLQSIKLPQSVTSIGDEAFYGCSALESLVLPNSTKTLGNSAFFYCPSLKQITLSNSLTDIGPYAFSSCNLTNIEIPQSVNNIGEGAFKNSKQLTTVKFLNSATKIGKEAFAFCAALQSVEFGNSVVSIGEGAFGQCNSLKALDIPNSVESIGEAAFAWCTNLESISLPESIVEIGNNTFRGDTELYSINFPNNLTKIGSRAFMVTKITTVIFPQTLTSIGSEAFASCTNIADIYAEMDTPFPLDDNVFSNTNAKLYVPSGCKAKYQSTAGWDKFKRIFEMSSIRGDANNDGVVNVADVVTIVNFLTNKKPEGFNSKMVDLNGDGNVTEADLQDIQGIIFNPNVNKFDGLDNSKEGNAGEDDGEESNISQTSLQGGDTFVLDGITYGVMSIVPKEVHVWSDAIDKEAIGAINIPAVVKGPDGNSYSVTGIGSYAFNGCNKLTSITIPNTVKIIDAWAFAGCTSLTSFKIPNEVTSIEQAAFQFCRSLKSITIPKSVVKIGDNYTGTFSDCESLESMIVESGNSVYDSRNNCNAIIKTNSNELIAGCKNTVIPNTVTSIGNGAFAGSKNLTSIILPPSIKSIGRVAFNQCGLTSIKIPAFVNYIGEGAFTYCNLLRIDSEVEKPFAIDDGVFSYYIAIATGEPLISNDLVLYVPKGKINVYQATDGWKKITQIKEL